MPNPTMLYEGTTGRLIAKLDIRGGLLDRPWLSELSGVSMEASAEFGLGDPGAGRPANYSAVVDGSRQTTKLIGEPLVSSDYRGESLFEAASQRVQLALGDGSAVTFGSVALTQPDASHADYFNSTTDPKLPPAPRGAQAPAFLQTGAATWDLSATDGILRVEINGEAFAVTVGTSATTALATVRNAIIAAGWPVHTALQSTDRLRLFTPGLGLTQNIKAIGGADTVGLALFPGTGATSAAGTLYRGSGGPLGQMSNAPGVSGGVKPQRRILPGSIVITLVVSGETIEVTDAVITSGSTGTLSGQNVAGTVTVTGTINYVTGAISITSSAAPTNASAITASWKALVPIDLHSPVRKSPAGRDIARVLN